MSIVYLRNRNAIVNSRERREREGERGEKRGTGGGGERELTLAKVSPVSVETSLSFISSKSCLFPINIRPVGIWSTFSCKTTKHHTTQQWFSCTTNNARYMCTSFFPQLLGILNKWHNTSISHTQTHFSSKCYIYNSFPQNVGSLPIPIKRVQEMYANWTQFITTYIIYFSSICFSS